MKKKFLCVATASVLAASMLAGCGGGDDSAASSQGSTESSSAATDSSSAATDSSAAASSDAGGEENGLLPALSEAEQGKPSHLTTPRSNYVQYPYADGEGVTLKFWMSVPGNVANNPATADSVKDTQWAQLWAENTGINIEWVGPTSDADTAFNLMTTSTELPDIIEWEWTSSYSGGPSAAESDGVLIWLDDYITPDGPAADLWQYLQDNPTLDKAVKTDDGHYYCFPFTRGDAYLQTTSGPIVRKDVIEEAGFSLDDMVTIDDWTEILTAVKDLGYTKPITTGSWGNLEQLCLPAYNVRPSMYVDYETGKVKYGNMEEGYKQFLAQMVAWREAGILDQDILTNSNTERQNNMLSADKISVVTYGAGGGQIGTWNTSAKKEPETYGESYELTGVQFPVLKEGDEIHYAGGSTDYAITSKAHAVITADCQYPEVAAAFLNYAYTQAGHEVLNFGVEGTDYTKNADGTITYSDWIMNNPDGLSIAVAMANKGRANMSGAFVQDPNYIIAYWNTEAQQSALHMWNDETDVQMTIMPPVTLTADESTEYARLMADINTATNEYRSAVFTGEKNLEGDWDAYVEQIKGMGIEQAIALQQAALDRYNAR